MATTQNDPYYHYDPYTAKSSSAAGTNSFAITSLIFGISAYCLLPLLGAMVAIVTGHIAQGQIRESRGSQGGSGLASAGLALGYIQMAMAFIAGLILAAVILTGGSVLKQMIEDGQIEFPNAKVNIQAGGDSVKIDAGVGNRAGIKIEAANPDHAHPRVKIEAGVDGQPSVKLEHGTIEIQPPEPPKAPKAEAPLPNKNSGD